MQSWVKVKPCGIAPNCPPYQSKCVSALLDSVVVLNNDWLLVHYGHTYSLKCYKRVWCQSLQADHMAVFSLTVSQLTSKTQTLARKLVPLALLSSHTLNQNEQCQQRYPAHAFVFVIFILDDWPAVNSTLPAPTLHAGRESRDAVTSALHHRRSSLGASTTILTRSESSRTCPLLTCSPLLSACNAWLHHFYLKELFHFIVMPGCCSWMFKVRNNLIADFLETCSFSFISFF